MINVGDKIGSYIIESIVDTTINAICSICGERFQLTYTNDTEVITVLNSLSCTENPATPVDYRLYVGKKVGSFIVEKYLEEDVYGDGEIILYSIIAKCLYCHAVLSAENFDSTEELVKIMRAYSCKMELPKPEPPVSYSEMSQIKRAKYDIAYFMNMPDIIKRLQLKQQEEEIERLREEFRKENENNPPSEEENLPSAGEEDIPTKENNEDITEKDEE